MALHIVSTADTRIDARDTTHRDRLEAWRPSQSPALSAVKPNDGGHRVVRYACGRPREDLASEQRIEIDATVNHMDVVAGARDIETTNRGGDVSDHDKPEAFSPKTSEVLDKAAFLVITARKEAAELIARAKVTVPDDGFGFGCPCEVHVEGFGTCPCSNYTGNGGPCLTKVTFDPGASPPLRACGHPAMKHLSN